MGSPGVRAPLIPAGTQVGVEVIGWVIRLPRLAMRNPLTGHTELVASREMGTKHLRPGSHPEETAT